jgi:transposase
MLWVIHIGNFIHDFAAGCEIYDRNIENGLTPQMKELIESQYDMLLIFDEKIDKLDIQIEQISKQDEVCQRLQKIEGIGPITALAIIALVGNGQGFKNGRHFSAYLGCRSVITKGNWRNKYQAILS